jgi:hypothetical protein
MSRVLHLLCLVSMSSACAETLPPTAEGTTWKYQMIQEFGQGVRPNDSSVTPDPDGKVRLPITIAVAGMEKIDGV